MKSCLVILLYSISTLAVGQNQWKDVYTEKAWAERDKWQRANDIIRELVIKPGSKVADVGCHEGYMTVKLAAQVGVAGKVYSVDVDQAKLDKLKNNSAKRNITNVEVIKGDYDNPKLPLNVLDAVIILDTYHEMDDHDKILQQIKASLKPGGRLVICEPIAEERRTLNREDQERKHELGMNYALDDLNKAGFSILKKQDPFVDRSKEKGDKMWLIVAVRK
jgi:precorrin-6B methylase 2